MKNNYMLSKNIKQYLRNKGIKQTFLSAKIGVSDVTLNSMLNGNRKITAEEYFQICTVLNVELETFRNDLKDIS